MRLVERAVGRSLYAWTALLLLQGLIPALTALSSRPLVNALSRLVSPDNPGRTAEVFGWAAVLGGLLVLAELLQAALDWVRASIAERVQDYVSLLIHARSTSVDLALYENPDFHDRLHRARTDAATKPMALMESLGALFQNAVSVIAMMTAVLAFGPVVPAVLLIATVPGVLLVLRTNRAFHVWWEQTTAQRRWTQYYDFMVTSSLCAAELRLLDLGAQFARAHQQLRSRLRAERLQLLRRQSATRLIALSFGLLSTGGAMAWILARVALRALSLGDCALIGQALYRGQSGLRTLLSNAGQVYANQLFLANLFEFLDQQPKISAPRRPLALPEHLHEGIWIRDVFFRYPESSRAALSGLTLHIPAGSIVALVGANGAGKSTLIKLLCRFYDPGQGAIEIDGVDLRNCVPEQVRARLSVLFQHPVAFQATLRDNIAFGCAAAPPDPSALNAAAAAAGLSTLVGRLPAGLDTLAGNWFANGTELSAGEWQRLATARSYYRPALLSILDEPTSFIDAWTEAEWFDRFRSQIAGGTAIVATHRLSIASRADIIYVLAGGRVAESGSHSELLFQNGTYAALWARQSQASHSLKSPETVIPAGCSLTRGPNYL